MTTSEFFAIFTYGANWDIQLNLIFVLGAVIYLLCTGPLVSKIPNAEPVPVKQKMYFLFGWGLYYLSMGSPLRILASELFSMHMLQMSIQYLLMPPFLLLGLPAWSLRPLGRFKWLKKIGVFLTKPMMILFLFNGLISIYHFPFIFDSIMSSVFLHSLTHYILLATALCMWWPVVCPVPEADRVKPLHKLGFIFANGVLLTPACALIMFANEPLFDTYNKMSSLAPIMSPLHDQVLGGVTMKIAQEVIYITAIAIIFSRWFRQQRKQDKQEMQEWMEGTSQKPAMTTK